MTSPLVTIVGNPRAGSRTHRIAAEAAAHLARRIGLPAPDQTIDLTGLAPHLFTPFPSAEVEAAVDLAEDARLLLVASPTYKGTYTGLLKAFLDRLPSGALAGAVAIPLLVMADPRHALAVEVHLRPLLVELGAAVPTPGLAVLDSQLADLDDVLGRWADQVAPQAAAALRDHPGAARPEAARPETARPETALQETALREGAVR